MMDNKLFKRLVDSMDQMNEITRGEQAPSREFHVDASQVKEIQKITGLSQADFCHLIDVQVSALRN